MYRKIKGTEGLRRTRGMRVLAFVLALAATCATNLARAVTVRLTDADSSSVVTVHVGDRIRLELHAAPATGFRWAAKKLDASHLEEMGKGIRPDSGRLDTAGTQIFVWKAISAGNATIALEYSRPNDDRTIPPEKRMDLKVEVATGELVPAPPGSDELMAPTLQPLASYQGSLPCADCLALAVQLNLYARTKDAATGIFVETRRYKGAPGGDKTIARTGKFAVVHGTYADPSIMVYVLGALEGGTENFSAEPDRLVPLDPQGLPIAQAPGRDLSLHRLKANDDF